MFNVFVLQAENENKCEVWLPWVPNLGEKLAVQYRADREIKYVEGKVVAKEYVANLESSKVFLVVQDS